MSIIETRQTELAMLVMTDDRQTLVDLNKYTPGRYSVGTDRSDGIYLQVGDTAFRFELERQPEVWILRTAPGIELWSKPGNKRFEEAELSAGEEFALRIQGKEILQLRFLIAQRFAGRDFHCKIGLNGTSFTISTKPNARIQVAGGAIEDSALLQLQGGKWTLETKHFGSCGVFFNGTALWSKTAIHSMDFFSVGSVLFYFTGKELYTNKDAQIKIEGLESEIVSDSESALDYPIFARSSRMVYCVRTEPIEMLPPKDLGEKEDVSLLTTLIPSIVMLCLLVVLRGMMGSGGMFVIYSCVSMTMGITTSIFAYFHRKRRNAEKEVKRRERYLTYTEKKVAEITKRRQEEIVTLNKTYRPADDNIRIIDKFEKGLFDRSNTDPDFMQVRIGTGVQRALSPIKVTPQEYKDTDDEFADVPEIIADSYQTIDHAPVILHMGSDNAVGIVGRKQRCMELVKLMTLDLLARHYYKDLKFYYLFPEGDWDNFAWARWLHNCFDEKTDIRNLMYDSESIKLHLENIYKILSYREDELHNVSRNKEAKWPTYYVVFVMDVEPIRNHPVSRYFRYCTALGFTFVFFHEHEECIPAGCGEMVYLDHANRYGRLYQTPHAERYTEFSYSNITNDTINRIAQKLCPVNVVDVGLENELTSNISFYQLMGVKSAEEMDVGARWAKSQIDKSMAVPLGVRTKNEIVRLDLHERGHGPHGLVAGTTGSGKSEILQSYILSMAIHFHPHEVAFLIIDFKGGGMVNQFERLPHLLGAITNIDGREIDRSLKSIKAELLRRQALFAQYGVNRIDAYIDRHKADPVAVPIPLPHLIIIVDEFAELKSEHPDFMKELISTARIGRSLGVHLILATQKPSGVVDEQIWSNSRFKLCLKVQTKEDSREVLKTPLAAEITEPGRAYMQVGNDELFLLFQSAYSGATVEKPGAGAEKAFRISSVNGWGKRTVLYNQGKNEHQDEEKLTQLDAVVNYIHDYCEQHNVEQLSDICMAPLPKRLLLSELKHSEIKHDGSVIVPVAMFDDPDQQTQATHEIDLGDGHLFVIGASQMGKTTFLQTLLYSLVENYSPDEINVYVLDAGNMAMKVFENAPQVGGVVLLNEEDKLRNLIKMLKSQIVDRKNVFVKHGVGTFSAYLEAGKRDLPLIVLMIDNIAAVREYYPNFDGDLLTLTRDGQSVGISIVITGAQSNNVQARALANINTRIAFTCNEKSEYTTLLGRTKLEPLETPGRVLVMRNKTILEAQMALCAPGEREIDRVNAIRSLVEEQREENGDRHAKRIPIVPEIIRLNDLRRENPELFEKDYSLPLAMNYSSIEYEMLDLAHDVTLALSGRENGGKRNFATYVMQTLSENAFKAPVNAYVFDGGQHALRKLSDMSIVKDYTADASTAAAIIAELYDDMQQRQKAYFALEDVEEQEKLFATWPLNLIVIGGTGMFDRLNSARETAGQLAQMLTALRGVKTFILFDEIPNAKISSMASISGELLKAIADSRHLMVFEEYPLIQVFEVSGLNKEFAKPIDVGDAFLLDGQRVKKMKTILANDN